MFDPTCIWLNGKWGYIMTHTGADYNQTPWHIKYNPLRWQIGIGRKRPCFIVLNKDGRAYRILSNLKFKFFGRKRRN